MKQNLNTKPYLILANINGDNKKIIIEKDRIIIGRLENQNDISLSPDPQKLVTRYMHCSIEIKNNTPYIIDNASKNGTFLKRNNKILQVKGEIKLADDDIIMILKKIGADEPPEYWEIEFKDPLATGSVENFTSTISYDWIQAKLFLNQDKNVTEINTLTPLEHKLIRYMDQKNKSNENIPVMCTYDELISILWEDSYSHTKNDVNHIVAALRKKIEVDYKNPKFLLNIRGMGYRLITN